MPNPFDQFDEQPPAASGVNPFDQFDDQPDSAPAPAAIAPYQGGGRSANAQRLAAKRESSEDQFRQQSAQMGVPYARDLEEIGAAPEMNAFSMPALKASAGALFTFDDKELGDILTKQVGAEIIQDAEGNYIAKMPSGKAYAVNKPGASAQDLAKFAANAAAFTPAGSVKNVIGAGLAGAATQGAIEGGQVALGGQVDPLDVTMAAAAPAVIAGAGKAARAISSRFSSKSPVVNEYLEEQLKGGVKSASGMTDDAAKVGQTQTMNMQPQFRDGAKKAVIRQGIKDGTVDGLGYRLDQNGRIVKDSVQRELVKKGLSDKVVAASSTLSPGDKRAALKMLDKADAFMRGVKGSEVDRPLAVVGENALKRFDVIAGAQEKASERIGEAVKTELKGKPIDISGPLDEFMEKLEKQLRVQVDGNRLIFKGSNIDGSDVGPIRRVFDRVRASYDDAAELHEVKQFLSNQVNYGAPAGKPLDRQAENAIKALRGQINDALRAASPKYAAANDDYAKAAGVLEPFKKVMPKDFVLKTDRLDSRVGQEMRKTISNYAKSNDLIDLIDDLNRVAAEFGGKFDDDIMSQVMLNSELERVLGSFAPGSMQGVNEKAFGVAMDRFGSSKAQLAKAVYNEAKDRVIFTPPSKEKLELIRQWRDLYSR